MLARTLAFPVSWVLMPFVCHYQNECTFNAYYNILLYLQTNSFLIPGSFHGGLLYLECRLLGASRGH